MGKKKKFNDHPFAYHEELELEITTLTNLGLGLGRVSLGDRGPVGLGGAPAGSSGAEGGGWVVMVPFALPGERVRARVFRNQKNFSEADLVEVLRASPHRVTPGCPLFGTCGGCQYQNLDYGRQLQWKRQQVGELLRHMAGVDFAVEPVIGSPRQYGYRSKITPHFAVSRRNVSAAAPPKEATSLEGADTSGQEGDQGAQSPTQPIGFLKQGTRFELVDVPQCPIATPEINAKLPEVREKTRRRLAAGEYKRDATLLLRHALEGVVTDYEAVITEEVAVANPPSAVSGPRALRLSFLARDFFQNNPFILPAFVDYVCRQASGAPAGSPRFLVDAYCGSGLFALAAAARFERVTGIEISESSIAFARRNAAANGIANATFRSGDAAAIFAGLDFPPAETALVIDPPRAGCDEAFLRQLFAFGPRTVVYVSCDPATQMRDLRHFLAGGYRLRAVQPFDLFPQTRHLECVITLDRGP